MPDPQSPIASSLGASPVAGSATDFDALLAQYGQGLDTTSKQAQAAYGKALPILQQYGAAEQALKPPPPPQTTPPPQSQSANPIAAFGSLAMAFAGLGSALTRTPMTTALNAAAGVMNAYKQNNLDDAKMAMSDWSAKTDYALKMHEYQNELYRESLEKIRAGEQGALDELKIELGATQDQAALRTLQLHNTEGLERLLQSRNNLALRLQENQGKLAEQSIKANMLLEWQQQNGKGPYTPQQMAELREIGATISGKGGQLMPEQYLAGAQRLYKASQRPPSATDLPGAPVLGMDGNRMPPFAEWYKTEYPKFAGPPPAGLPTSSEEGGGHKPAAVPTAGSAGDDARLGKAKQALTNGYDRDAVRAAFVADGGDGAAFDKAFPASAAESAAAPPPM